MNINIIVSYANNLIIGNDNSDNIAEWFDDEYLTYFSEIIKHHPDPIINKKNIVIIGNTTYNKATSFISVLKNSVETNDIILIVIKKMDNECDSSHSNIHCENGIYTVDSLGTSMEICTDLYNDGIIDNIFIAGGESIYTYYLTSYYYKLLNKVYITRIHKAICGNKTFYGLEDKFYYISIDKKERYQENKEQKQQNQQKTYIEYRVLQYDKDFKNGETMYLNFIRKTLQSYEKYGYSTDQSTFEISIDLTKYFPVFSMFKQNINHIINQLFGSIKKCENIKEINDTLISISIDKNNEVINKKQILNFFDKPPFNSSYSFYINENILSCDIIHRFGNILNDVFMNIVFSALLVHLYCELLGLKPYILNYKCLDARYEEKEIIIMEKIAWNTPDVLSIIKIKNRRQKDIEDYTQNDIELLGMHI